MDGRGWKARPSGWTERSNPIAPLHPPSWRRTGARARERPPSHFHVELPRAHTQLPPSPSSHAPPPRFAIVNRASTVPLPSICPSSLVRASIESERSSQCSSRRLFSPCWPSRSGAPSLRYVELRVRAFSPHHTTAGARLGGCASLALRVVLRVPSLRHASLLLPRCPIAFRNCVYAAYECGLRRR